MKFEIEFKAFIVECGDIKAICPGINGGFKMDKELIDFVVTHFKTNYPGIEIRFGGENMNWPII